MLINKANGITLRRTKDNFLILAPSTPTRCNTKTKTKTKTLSGRLIITTKKSYCPWNAANVERVLRDERLERERLVRQQQQSEENQSHHTHLEKREPQGHINLFPEAREAEIRLTQVNTNDVEKNDSNGILNVPLGGDESNNRKNGKVPFYMQAQSQQEETYDKSSYLGIRRSRSGAAPADKITDTLMRDQFTSREEYRKQKNDPMSRFYDDSTDAARNIYANRESSSRADHDLQSNCHATSFQEIDYSLEPQPQAHERTKSRKRKSNSSEDADDNDDGSEASSSSLSLLGGRKHDHKNNQTSKHSSSSHGHHRRKKSPLHYKKKRRKDKKTKRKHCSKDRGEDEGDRPERYHHPSSPQSNIDLLKRNKSGTHQLEDMRRRRHAREAREMERQRRLM
eukprot:scaffold21663_cov148-Skeletonema_dohrnii-CCMP3373.AAC.1